MSTDAEQPVRLTRGASVETHDRLGGAVVSLVSDVEPGDEAETVEVDVEAVREAVAERLTDDYDSVFAWCDGDALAFTDHRSGFEESNLDGVEGAPSLADLEGVHRVRSVSPHDDAVCSLFDRELLLIALDELPATGAIRVHVSDDWPIVFETDGSGVAVTPRLLAGTEKHAEVMEGRR